MLASLQTKEFVYEQPAFPEVEYLFKHALTQDVAYGTVLQEQRKALHERTGQAIEGLYRTSLGDHYSELAHHYSRSENTTKAVEYLGLAGQRAVQRSANLEAIVQLSTGLELLQQLPDTQERARSELELQVTLGPALIATQGWSSADAGRSYTRANELCQQLGATSQRFPVQYGLWLSYLGRAELKKGLEVGEQLLSVALSNQEASFVVEAHLALGITLYYLGEFAQARDHLEQGSARFEPEQHRALFGFNPGMACLGFAAWTLWLLGYPDQALGKAHQALVLVDDTSPFFDQTVAHDYAARLHLYLREVSSTRNHADAIVRLSTEHSLAFYKALGPIFQGWAWTEQGQAAEGLVRIRHGLAAFRATDSAVRIPSHLATLAVAYGKAEQVDEGLNAVAEALVLVRTNGERLNEAELHRLKGELTLQQSQDATEAESCFHTALEISQKQHAKSWELRAATSLARLWQGQGKTAEAYDLLAPVYDWFTEGFETADLKDANALLEELGGGQG